MKMEMSGNEKTELKFLQKCTIIDKWNTYDLFGEVFLLINWFELAELDKNTGMVSEARMDLIAEMLELRAMLDVRVF